MKFRSGIFWNDDYRKKKKPQVYLVCIILVQTNVQQAVLPLPSTSAIAWRHQHAVHTAEPCLLCRRTGRSACLVERGRKHAFDCNSASIPYGHKDTSTRMSAQIWLQLWGLLWVKNCKDPNSAEYMCKCWRKIKNPTKPDLVAQWINPYQRPRCLGTWSSNV